MLLYAQTWLPLLTITLTAAIFFGVASFMMADARKCGSAYGHRRLLRTYAGVAARNRD